jgi:phenylpropionate dioxygenase-like ring-hydroxylating dioxygenase large terminal subunit
VTLHQSEFDQRAAEEPFVGARCPDAPSVQDVYREDNGGLVPAELREHPGGDGTDGIPRYRYYSRLFHDLEMEHVWKRTWQWACLESDIPEVGDTYVYDIGSMSILIARVAEDTIKAYWNSCLHRGTQLRACGGRVCELRCVFHGWAWELDGSLKDLPGAWDLEHLNKKELALPEVQADTWGGFVFVNPDLNAGPLCNYLGVLPEHFHRWPLENRVKTAHAVKLFKCNWKIALGAFSEAYHLVSLHPQIVPIIAAENTQYDVFDGHVSRLITLGGTCTPALAKTVTEQEILDLTLESAGVPDRILLQDGQTARTALRRMMEDQTKAFLGLDELPCSSGELLDVIVYYLFPNLAVWAGFTYPIVYRFRPYGDDPEMSIMDVLVLTPFPDGAERPKPAPEHWLQPDDSFTEVDGIPFAEVMDQDNENLPRIQRGLKSSVRDVHLCRYQESLIRRHDDLLTQYIDQFSRFT